MKRITRDQIAKKRFREEFTERDYEAKTSGGEPFEAIWKQANHEPNQNGTNKPAVKGTPHFDYEEASDSNNKPSCPCANDTYEVKYGGSLNERDWNRPALDVLLERLGNKNSRRRVREDFDYPKAPGVGNSKAEYNFSGDEEKPSDDGVCDGHNRPGMSGSDPCTNQSGQDFSSNPKLLEQIFQKAISKRS